MSRIIVVTGANRGIGLEVARQLGARGDAVYLSARDPAAGHGAARRLERGGVTVEPLALDVTDHAGIRAAAERVENDHGRLDVLVNNAGAYYDTWETAAAADMATVRAALEVNLIGAWQVTLAFLPLLRRSAHGRVVNVSSESGSLATMGSGTPAYATSKAALNALTCTLAADLRSERILVNAVCPGWVATDMGGAGGRPVEVGAASVIWGVDLPDDGPTGGFFRDGQPLHW